MFFCVIQHELVHSLDQKEFRISSGLMEKLASSCGEEMHHNLGNCQGRNLQMVTAHVIQGT